MLPLLMMLPEPWRRMWGAACFMPSITLRTKVAIAASKRATSRPSMPPVCAGPPALLNRQSMRPNFSTAWPISAFICSSTVTSVWRNTHFAPSFLASRSPSGARRPAMTMLAPSATKISAVRSPMPLVAPVITAILPSSRPMSFSPFSRSWHSVYFRTDGTTQAMLALRRAAGRVFFRRPDLILDSPAGRCNVTHGEIDRRVSARLAGNIRTVAAFQHRICSLLPCPGDRGAVGSFPDPAGRILHPVFSCGVFCHRVMRPPGRDRDPNRRGHARHDYQFQRRHGGLGESDASGHLSDGVRPHDMGRRALPIDRLASAGDLRTPDERGGVSEARRRRIPAPAEKQIVDNSRRSPSGIAGPTANLGRHRSALAGAVRGRRSDRAGRRHRLRYQGSAAFRTRTLRTCAIYPERKSAVSSRPTGGEPGLDISRACHQCREIRRVFLHTRLVAGVMVRVGRSPQHYLGRDRGSSGRNRRGSRLWHQALEVGADAMRRQDRGRLFADRGSLHDAMPHPPELSALPRPTPRSRAHRNNAALTRGERSLYQ